MAHSLGFYGDGISFWVVSGQVMLTPMSQGPSWWCTHCPAKMNPSEEDPGRLVGPVASPFDLSRILPVGGDLGVLRIPCQDLRS